MSGKRLSRCLMAILMAVLVVRTVRMYANAVSVERAFRGRTPASYFRPGLVPASDWIKAHARRSVFGLPHGEDKYLCERLSEMLYPIPYQATGSVTAMRGDLLVLPAGREPTEEWAPAFESG